MFFCVLINYSLFLISRINAELESPGLESAPLLPAESTTQPAPVRFINSESGDYSVDLPTFLIQRACANSALVNYFYWSVNFVHPLHVEKEKKNQIFYLFLKVFNDRM